MKNSKKEYRTEAEKREDVKRHSEFSEIKDDKEKKRKLQTFLFWTIGLVMSLALVNFAFELKTKVNSSNVNLASSDGISEELLDIPLTEQKQPPPPKKVQPEIISVPDEDEIKEEIEIDLDIEMTEETKIEEAIFKEATLPEEEAVDAIFTIVETQPVGREEFYKYISKKLKYPAQARRMGIEGIVFVEFVIDKDGSITQVEAIKGIGAGCNEEAIRIVKGAPKWKPGKQRGREVKVRMILPIHFKLK